MTTAHYRTLAQDFEARLDWQRAAETWQGAIDAYPKHAGTATLADRDIANMAERRDCCMRMAK